MIFNSVTFLTFLVLVVALYWALPFRARMWMLLVASCVFYGFWKWQYLSVMFISALTDYFTAQAIYATPPERRGRRRLLLGVTLGVNLGLLGYFKYLYFLTTNANAALHLAGVNYSLPLFQVILPLGISFYTFETISYTVDVYRGLLKPETSFVNYGLFVTFFPKLVAGPIQRAGELLAQFKNRPRFEVDYLSEGCKRILYGLFLKVGLADNFSDLVDEGFGLTAGQLSALDVWTLAFLFGFQIYFDFAGYSHIAIGTAKLMGITVPENFNYPYLASSFRDFWKRWHISLSSWIRDYVYLPMAGVKVLKSTGRGGIGDNVENEPRPTDKTRALFLTWAVMGFWHGANWTFIAWGIYHACMIFLERLGKPLRERWGILRHPFTGWMLTVPLAMLGWIFFRATTLGQAWVMLGKVIDPREYLRHLAMRENTYLTAAALFAAVIVAYFARKYLAPWLERHAAAGFVARVALYTVLIIVVFTFLRPIKQYIYFQF